jgi:hypothetical protein
VATGRLVGAADYPRLGSSRAIAVMGGLTVADLTEAAMLRLLDELRPRQPVLRRVWCIDRRFDMLREAVEKLAPATPGIPKQVGASLWIGLYGVPVVEWWSWARGERDFEPLVGTEPGYWLEMSDGNHIRLREPLNGR